MAYIARRPGGSWELRESHTTPRGPRSRTLASFRSLSPEVIARAQERAKARISPSDLRRLAIRAGVPVVGAVADDAAAALLAELERGRGPSPARRRMLMAALGDGTGKATEAERAVAPWLAATPKARGEVLRDLLLLADSLPSRKRPAASRFPRLESRAA